VADRFVFEEKRFATHVLKAGVRDNCTDTNEEDCECVMCGELEEELEEPATFEAEPQQW
jgi:hypothetical protein